jgi:nitrogenase molybdenum-iron protein beta chain
MLDKTPKELYSRKALKINPAKTCQPIGAMYAALGIHKCLPHSHGSQGCCSFHRMQLSRHFKEPVMASTSSFTEGSSVFGGGTNLKTAAKNIFTIYEPDMIAVHTTCLSETIGDDLKTIISQCEVPQGKYIIHSNTPSYVGSHVTGFSNMVKGMITYLAENTGIENGKVNILPGFISPGDMREIKRLLKIMGIPFIMLPDTSGVVDTPMTGSFEMYPKGGTRIEDLKDTGNSIYTLALGKFSSEAAASALERKCKVPMQVLNIPIGIDAVDKFLTVLSRITGKEVPEEIEEERGQVVDLMLDSHQYFYGTKVAIFGDPDTIISLTEFVLSLGMEPKYIITGTPGESFVSEIKNMLKAAKVKDCIVKSEADLFELHQQIKNGPVDLLIGNTYGKYIARAEDIPFVRFGFPILDRYAHQYLPTTGYKGAIRLMEMMLNALLDRKDRDTKDEDFELIY